MRILFFSPYYYPYISGITLHSLRLLNELNKHHDVQVITFMNSGSQFETQKSKIPVCKIPFLLKVSKGFISPQSLYYFIKYLLRSDILFVTIPNFEGLPLVILAKLFRKPVLAHYHCEVELGHSLFERIVVFFLNLSVHFQLIFADAITTHSPGYAQKMKLKEKYGDVIHYVLPPIPRPSFSRTYYNRLMKNKGPQFWVGFVGRFAREKGIVHLIGAAEKFYNKHRDIHLLFVGPTKEEVIGEGDYANDMIRKIEKSKFKYSLLGRLHSPDLFALYKSLDVLVLPSTNKSEAFGLVQCEAMFMNTPVIASNLPGVADPISLSRMGILVEPGNVHQLYKALEKMHKRKSLKYSQHQVESFVRLFDPGTIAIKYQEILTKLLHHDTLIK